MQLIAHAKLAHHTIKVYRAMLRGYNATDELSPVYCYAITGGRWSVGTLLSDKHTPQELFDRAVEVTRVDHPRAPLYIVMPLEGTP